MIKDFLINAAILISFLSVYFQILRNRNLGPLLQGKEKVILGGILGLLGVSLMGFGVKLPNNLVIDFRNLAVILSAICGGWISALVSAIIISVFRIALNGINYSSIAAITVIAIITPVSCFIAGLNIKGHLKWIYAIGVSELITSAAFFVIIGDAAWRNTLILSYCIALSLVSFLVYFYVLFLEGQTNSYIRYKHEAKMDFLTGLNNLRQFDKLYNNIISSAIAKHQAVSLLFIDIDYFKNVNDTYGHREGDLVLKKLSELLRRTCRTDDVLSRNGGEEFSVILLDCLPAQALEIGERICQVVQSTPFQLTNGTIINITVSIGVSSYPEPLQNPDLLVEEADKALYEAKKTGRNKVVLCR